MRRIFTLACLALLSGPAPATDRHVPSVYPTIQSALNAAFNGDAVIVQPGTYSENLNTLGKDIRIIGVGAGATVSGSPGSPVLTVGSASTNSYYNNLTIRNGDGLLGGGVAVGANARPTFEDCRFWQNSASGGGAMFVFANASVTILSCDIWANHADAEGGAISLLAGASLTLADTLLEANTADLSGGAIRAFDATLDISGTTHFLNNSAVQDGGAIEALDGASITMTSTRFTGNQSGFSGGAIYAEAAGISSHLCTFTSNSAVAPGGAILLLDAAVGFSSYDTFVGNTALNGGAIRVLESGLLANVAYFRDNTAADFGGAVAVTGNANPAAALIFNSGIDANTARFGGASFINVGPASAGATSVLFANCEITNNTASIPTGQGGIGVGQNGTPHADTLVSVVNSTITRNAGGNRNGFDVDSSSRVALLNSIVWNNAGPGLSGSWHGQQISHSIFPETGTFAGTANINADPRLRNPAAGDFALLMTSPAIDAGNSTLVPSDTIDDDGDGNTTEQLPLDLRGYARFVNDPLTPDTGIDAGMGVVDIGAHEFRRTCVADFAEPITVINFDDVLAFLSAFSAMQPIADIAPAFGVHDFDDVLAFLSAFGSGCPG